MALQERTALQMLPSWLWSVTSLLCRRSYKIDTDFGSIIGSLERPYKSAPHGRCCHHSWGPPLRCCAAGIAPDTDLGVS